MVSALAVLTVLAACTGPSDAQSGTPGDAPVYAPAGAPAGAQGGPGGGSDPVIDKVSGALAASRHVPVRTVQGSRPHLVSECHPVTKQVRRTTGSGKRRTTTSTTVRTTECISVQHGTETYRKVVSVERWCVELDNVDGHTDQDHRWYQVTPADYQQALGRSPGTPLTLRPTSDGC